MSFLQLLGELATLCLLAFTCYVIFAAITGRLFGNED